MDIPKRSSKGIAGVGLGIYAGQWIPRLSALALEPGIAVWSEEQANDVLKIKDTKAYDTSGLDWG